MNDTCISSFILKDACTSELLNKLEDGSISGREKA